MIKYLWQRDCVERIVVMVVASSSENPNWIYAGEQRWICGAMVSSHYMFRIHPIQLIFNICLEGCRDSFYGVRQQLKTFNRCGGWGCHFHFIFVSFAVCTFNSYVERNSHCTGDGYTLHVVAISEIGEWDFRAWWSLHIEHSTISFALYRLPHNHFVWFTICQFYRWRCACC